VQKQRLWNNKCNAGILVYRIERGQSEVLFLKCRKTQRWEFPYGACEVGDTSPWRTGTREWFEEVGVRLPHLSNKTNFSPIKNCVTFVGKVDNTSLKNGRRTWQLTHFRREHDQAMWVKVADVNLRKKTFYGKESIRGCAIKSLQEAITKGCFR
jgi:8-oxo-dGTP pyrophosphatase MutT (NUDIX family)